MYSKDLQDGYHDASLNTILVVDDENSITTCKNNKIWAVTGWDYGNTGNGSKPYMLNDIVCSMDVENNVRSYKVIDNIFIGSSNLDIFSSMFSTYISCSGLDFSEVVSDDISNSIFIENTQVVTKDIV